MREWKSISPALEISPGLRPREISRASGWDMYWDISIHDTLLLFLSFDSHKTCHVYHKTFQIFLGWCEQPHICAFITGYTWKFYYSACYLGKQGRVKMIHTSFTMSLLISKRIFKIISILILLTDLWVIVYTLIMIDYVTLRRLNRLKRSWVRTGAVSVIMNAHLLLYKRMGTVFLGFSNIAGITLKNITL